MPTNLSAIPSTPLPPPLEENMPRSNLYYRVCETSRLIGWEWKLFRQVGSRVTSAPWPLVYFGWSIGTAFGWWDNIPMEFRECNNWTVENYLFPICKLVHGEKLFDSKIYIREWRMHWKLKKKPLGREETRLTMKLEIWTLNIREGKEKKERNL